MRATVEVVVSTIAIGVETIESATSVVVSFAGRRAARLEARARHLRSWRN